MCKCRERDVVTYLNPARSTFVVISRPWLCEADSNENVNLNGEKNDEHAVAAEARHRPSCLYVHVEDWRGRERERLTRATVVFLQRMFLSLSGVRNTRQSEEHTHAPRVYFTNRRRNERDSSE